MQIDYTSLRVLVDMDAVHESFVSVDNIEAGCKNE